LIKRLSSNREASVLTGPDDGLHRSEHHFANSGQTLTQYWKEAERCIKKAADVGIKMCGTVSTIWGSPITGATRLEDAVEFTKRFFSIGAHDIEHADHDGSASAAQVYRYFSMVLDAMPNPEAHLCHLHETKRVASASILAALQAGICRFEEPWAASAVSPPISSMTVREGTGEYYYKDPRYVGLITFEDLVVMIDELGIEHGYNVDRVLWLGAKMEKTIGRRLRSEAVYNGRTLKGGHPEFARPGLSKLIQKLGEKPGQLVPPEWPAAAVLPEKWDPWPGRNRMGLQPANYATGFRRREGHIRLRARMFHELMSRDREDGVPPGNHRVLVPRRT